MVNSCGATHHPTTSITTGLRTRYHGPTTHTTTPNSARHTHDRTRKPQEPTETHDGPIRTHTTRAKHTIHTTHKPRKSTARHLTHLRPPARHGHLRPVRRGRHKRHRQSRTLPLVLPEIQPIRPRRHRCRHHRRCNRPRDRQPNLPGCCSSSFPGAHPLLRRVGFKIVLRAGIFSGRACVDSSVCLCVRSMFGVPEVSGVNEWRRPCSVSCVHE